MNAVHHLKDLALSETGFVFDPCSGATFTVNPTGLAILQALRDGLSRAEVRERLVERFDAPKSEVDRDLNDFVDILRQHDLLSNDFAF